MAQTGYTPISLYYSTTASAVPLAANLASGELAINITDGKLYYKNNGGTVTLLAGAGGAISPITNNGVVYVNSSGQATSGSTLTYDGTRLTAIVESASEVDIARFQASNSGDIQFLDISADAVSNFVAFDVSGSTGGDYIFRRGGTEQMRLTGTGLGIGTSSPAAKVNATSTSNSAITYPAYFDNNGSGSGTGSRIGFRNSGGVYGSIGYLYNGSNFQLDIDTVSSGFMSFKNAGSEQMRLDSSGNLGLGVTPTTGGYGKGFQFSADIASDLGTLWIQPINTNDHRVSLTNNAKNTGVGTWGYFASSQSATMYQQVAGEHQWYTASTGTAGNAITFTQAMTLDASGRLGIGQTSPAYKLDIRNNVLASTSLDPTTIYMYNNNDGGSGIEFLNAVGGKSKISFGVESTGAGTDDTYIGFSTSVNAGALTERARINSSGNFFLSSGYMSFGNNGYIRADISNSLAIQAGSSTSVGWQVRTSDNATTKLSMSGTGGTSLALEGATPNTGTGITFPATQAPSADTNTLDDYEEGTWTPSFVYSSGSSTYTTQSGSYVKVGRLVTVSAIIVLSNKSTASGNVSIDLPFNSQGTSPINYWNMYYSSNNITITGYDISGQIGGNITNRLNFYNQISAGSKTSLDAGQFSNSTELIFTCTYQTSS